MLMYKLDDIRNIAVLFCTPCAFVLDLYYKTFGRRNRQYKMYLFGKSTCEVISRLCMFRSYVGYFLESYSIFYCRIDRLALFFHRSVFFVFAPIKGMRRGGRGWFLGTHQFWSLELKSRVGIVFGQIWFRVKIKGGDEIGEGLVLAWACYQRRCECSSKDQS